MILKLDDHAQRLLGRRGDSIAVEPLLAALQDVDDDVRGYTAVALARLQDKRAIVPIKALIERESNPEIKAAAIDALESLLSS